MTLVASLVLERPGFRLHAGLAAPAGKVTVLFGPSGAGKSTLLHAVAGLVRARGTCSLGTECWQDDARALFRPPEDRRAGMVFQDLRLFPHLDVAGNLRFAARRSGRPEDPGEMARRLGLGPLLDRPVGELSGGERQRVAIARALLARPRALLMDEPLASLDAAAKADILPWLESVFAELDVPVVYVTHSLDELVRLGDRVVPISGGRSEPAVSVSELLGRPDGPLSALGAAWQVCPHCRRSA